MFALLKETILVVILIFVFGYFWNDIYSGGQKVLGGFESATSTAEVAQEEGNLLPPPLQGGGSSSSQGALTTAGVIALTNIERAQNNAKPLSENAKLDASAETKVDDMFSKQYFAHESPTGVGPGDIASSSGYAYVLIGENLALGNFGGDQALINAWMASPGHRANILNIRFTDIGVAVKEGKYQGKETWLAVQEFGEPLSDCPSPSTDLENSIKTLEQTISNLDTDLASKKATLDSTNQSDPSYQSNAQAYNAEVNSYNNDLAHVQTLITTYNTEVKSFNSCVNG